VVLLNAGLAPRGFETLLVHGIVDDHEGSLEHLAQEAGIQVRRIPQLNRGINLFSDLRAWLQIARLVFNMRPDVVHTHTAKAGILGRVAALCYNVGHRRRKRCLVVHTFHGNVLSGYFGPLTSAFVRAAERLIALATDHIVVVAAQQREEIVDRFHIAPERKVKVVRLGLNLDGLLHLDESEASLRPDLGWDQTDVVFGFVGRLVPIKDPAVMIRALAAALPRAPKARLLMVGDGALRPELERLTESLGISRAVRFLGWRQQLSEVYRSIDIGILSSRNEGTPVALIEAMAAGRPVLSTAVGGVVEVVTPSVTGLLVPAGDVSAMADAMVSLVDGPEMRLRLGRAARQDVGQRYNRVRLIDETGDLYRSGLTAKRGSSN
jgi:glycosyltransferase involved in cell wall biosynthesis